jgi:hypothetical protein
LQAQWQVIKEAQLPATWLWQYSALENQKLTNFAQTQMPQQEFGLFLEIDRNFAQKANVQYRGRGPWYFSDGLFLVSYDRLERQKLIDTVFAKFKQTFGYYPKTVGAWWLGADSLTYMQQKYGIVASLRAADQFDLDVYSIWGTPWSIPYVASRQNAAIPATSWDKSTKVVTLQWAPRDPTRGFGESSQSSTYSIQDYTLKKYDISYFNYLTFVYLRKPLDNLVVGLEGGNTPQVYHGQYKQQITQIKQWEKQHKIIIATAKDYASRLSKEKKILPPTSYFLTKDFQNSNQSFWYNSPHIRVGIQKEGEKIVLQDLRDYSKAPLEDFALLPNSQGYLRINTPAIIDAIRFPQQKKLLAITKDPLQLQEGKNEITLWSGNKKIARFTPSRVQIQTEKPIQSLIFTPQMPSLSLFWILGLLFLLYSFTIVLFTKSKKTACVQIFFFVLPLILSYPFTNIQLPDIQNIIFDKKELVLAPIFSLPINNLAFKLTLIKLIPLLLLPLIHMLCFSKKKTNRHFNAIYYLYLAAVILLYFHLPYFPLDRSTYLQAAVVISILGIGGVIASFMTFLRTKSRQKSLPVLVATCFVLILLVTAILLARQKYIITPFELQALQTIAQSHQKVLLLMPADKPIYKAVRPLLAEDYRLAVNLTNTDWEKTSQQSNTNLSSYPGQIIFIPRYLGVDISIREIKQSHLTKIFDNAQIALFMTPKSE